MTHSIEKLVEIFYQDLIGAFHSVQEFRRLYMSSDLNTKILLSSAPGFFADHARLFWQDILMTISRMLDPAKQMGQENLSIEVLLRFAASKNMPCAGHLQADFEHIRVKGEKIIKTWRHKLLAHRDLRTALITDKRHLSVHIDEVEAILNAIGDCIQKTWGDERKVTLSWRVVPQGSTESLLNVLKNGLIYTNLKANRNNSEMDHKELNIYGPHLTS